MEDDWALRAGKVNAVAGVPGNPAIYYMGADGGGVWKTTDSGVTWGPTFDAEAFRSLLGKDNLGPLANVPSVAADVACGN